MRNPLSIKENTLNPNFLIDLCFAGTEMLRHSGKVYRPVMEPKFIASSASHSGNAY